jgi:hypothetical protein
MMRLQRDGVGDHPGLRPLHTIDFGGLVFGRKVAVDDPDAPRRANAMASLDSVTVSIAALIIGTFKGMSGVNLVEVSTVAGTTSDAAGSSSTSSKVNAWIPNFRETPLRSQTVRWGLERMPWNMLSRGRTLNTGPLRVQERSAALLLVPPEHPQCQSHPCFRQSPGHLRFGRRQRNPGVEIAHVGFDFFIPRVRILIR